MVLSSGRRAVSGFMQFGAGVFVGGVLIASVSMTCLPRGSIVVPFCGSYLEFYKVISKRNYYGSLGYTLPYVAPGMPD